MKNKLKNIAFATALFLAANFANAQVKIGANPTTIGTNSNLEVEATNANKVIITQDKGQILTGTTTVPTGGTNAKVIIDNGTTNGAIQIKDGTEGVGKVLKSDANGLGTWQDASNNRLVWNASRVITIPTTGFYLVTMYADDDANSSVFTNSYLDHSIVSGAFNGVALQDVSTGNYYLSNANDTPAYGVSCSGTVYLNAGTQISIGAQNWSGINPAIWCLEVVRL
jgi:hypothetical protein